MDDKFIINFGLINYTLVWYVDIIPNMRLPSSENVLRYSEREKQSYSHMKNISKWS